MNQQYHAEQMEAARAEFEKLWFTRLRPVVFMQGGSSVRITHEDLAFVQQACWLAFLAGFNKTP